MFLIKRKSIIYMIKCRKLSFNQYGSTIAMISHIYRIMRDDDHRTIFTFFEKFYTAFLVKTTIANSYDFIDQETIKLHHHANGESQSGTHAG